MKPRVRELWARARLRAPVHDVDLIVLAGGSGRTLAFAPGHLGASALPGVAGNSVIAAILGARELPLTAIKQVA